MHNHFVHCWKNLPGAFKLLIISLFALGLFFRFTYLDSRVYWHDETYTLLRASGHRLTEMAQQSFDGRVIDRDEILRYQQITPDKTLGDTLHSIVIEEPHRSPLYYVIGRWWMQGFGSDVVSMRLLSVLISLLVFPALYWLCLELFQQVLPAWIAIALMAVSPFHVYYAQEVREYALWTVTILLMALALLRAIRLNTPRSWSLYTVAIAASFYTSILTVPVIVGHLIYVIATEGFQRTTKTITFIKSLALGFLAYLPWLSFTFLNLQQVKRISAWMFQPTSLNILLEQWLANFQAIFFKDSLVGSLKWVFAIAIVVLVVWAMRSLFQRAPRKAWLFVSAMILPLFLGLAIPDLVLGGVRSTNARYFVPSYLGIQLAVAYLLATQWTQGRLAQRPTPKKSHWQQIQARLLLMTLIVAGVLSCTMQSILNQTSEDQHMAQLINQAESPIVLSNEVKDVWGGTIGDVMVLSHLLKPDAKFQLVIEPHVPVISQTSEQFVYKPLPFLKQHLDQKYQLIPIYKDKLFRITTPSKLSP